MREKKKRKHTHSQYRYTYTLIRTHTHTHGDTGAYFITHVCVHTHSSFMEKPLFVKNLWRFFLSKITKNER